MKPIVCVIAAALGLVTFSTFLPALPASPALPTPPALPAPPAQKAKTRLFAPEDLGLLEAPDRHEWNKPDQIMDALGIADGSVVAELGAGGGWFVIQLAGRVGPNGLVYAEDIQSQMIEVIQRRVQRERLHNVRTVLGTASDARLPPGLDAVLIFDAYHEIEDPVTLLRNVTRSLRPQGRLGIGDYTAGGGGPGPAAEERPDPGAVVKDATAAGLQLTKREDIPPFLYLLVFSRER
jgi:predicted methyltransferase